MLILFALGFLAGTSLLNIFSALPSLLPLSISCITILSICFGFWLIKSQPAKAIALFILSVVLGFSWAYFVASQKLQGDLPLADTQSVANVCGKVTGVTQRKDNRLRFDLSVTHYQDEKIKQPVKMRLYWQHPVYFLMDKDSLCASVKVKRRWSLANPGTVDQEKNLFLEEIVATGKVVQLQHYQPFKGMTLDRIRQQLNDNIEKLIGDKPFLGVIQATTIGIYHNIPSEQWQIFQATGTVHAIAISGLHISVIALLCGGWVTFMARRFPKLTNRMPAKCYGAIVALIGALLYAGLAGFSVPTQRALIMILISIIALLKRQPVLTWHALALACIGILLFDPLSTLQVGFWLSFSCVAALIYGASHSALSGWRKWIVPQWLVFIGLAPLCVYHFWQISWISPFANMIALPVIDLLVVPCCLIGVFLSLFSSSLATLLLSFANFALEIIWFVLEKMTNPSFHVGEIGHVPIGYVLMATIAALLLIAPYGLPGKRWAILGFLPMLLYQQPRPQQGDCFLSVLDVGQGLAAIIQTKNHTLLFDAGPVDAGNKVLKPFLLFEQIKTLDKVIISHGDLDHRGGLQALGHIPIGELLSSEPHKIEQAATLCHAGNSWEWDGVRFTLLNPQSVSNVRNRNNLSCVLRVETASHSILLTGDIEKEAEHALLRTYRNHLASTILVVPHHGSLTSSSQEFIQVVQPKYAVFPVGFANQYGFPKLAVLKRYEGLGAKNLLVSHTGALQFYLRQNTEIAAPKSWRESARRYWHRS